ncbi:hypothetical protein PHYPSEUDO_003542 [Phytophthora pseudosyringae]|uniref:Uncharacterized protein n=1 Tax=Phytophthora pseudosyringae TaxID=221518 RepID=A0A8T1V505_9STRA|nr:hypothetical protein PHYPSEUDO_003542 [Phytophthora pseudosyringae]
MEKERPCSMPAALALCEELHVLQASRSSSSVLAASTAETTSASATGDVEQSCAIPLVQEARHVIESANLVYDQTSRFVHSEAMFDCEVLAAAAHRRDGRCRYRR